MSVIEALHLPQIPEVIVVHGSGLHNNPNGAKGWWEERPDVPRPVESHDGITRVVAAAELWKEYAKQNKEVLFWVVGGKVYPEISQSTAQIMKLDAIDHGVKEDYIVEINRGGNTVSDTKAAVLQMRECWGYPPQAVNISSEFHLTAKTLADKNDFLVKISFGLVGERMRHVSAEAILENVTDDSGNYPYREAIAELRKDPTIQQLTEVQKKRAMILAIPFIGGLVYNYQANRTLVHRAEVTDFNPYVINANWERILPVRQSA